MRIGDATVNLLLKEPKFVVLVTAVRGQWRSWQRPMPAPVIELDGPGGEPQ